MFRKHVQKPPMRTLERIAEINVGELQKTALFHSGTKLTVEADPLEWNPAHAQIPQKITRGLANAILPKLRIHSPEN
jgi:hypothetical protein